MAKAKKKKVKDNRPFSERHPKLNVLLGLFVLICFAAGAVGIAYWAVEGMVVLIKKLGIALSELTSGMDAVVIVALITGAVSITGVVISSIVAKLIDYRKNRQDYLAKKREEPYGEFVEMVYKIQNNSKSPGGYTEAEMVADLLRFSRKITLWSSPAVANKWLKFRENGTNPDAGLANIFLMEEIMNEMRKDLGMKKVKKGNLLGFFINDIKETMKAVKK